MAIKGIFFASSMAVAVGAMAHPVSPEMLIPAPLRVPEGVLEVRNPQVLMQDAGPGFSERAVLKAQYQVLRFSGLKAGDCATMVTRAGGSTFSQTFSIQGTPQEPMIQRIVSGGGSAKDGVDLATWINAYGYAYRLPTQNVQVNGATVSVVMGKLKVCP